MWRQVVLDPLKQWGFSQQVEKIIGVKMVRMMVDPLLLMSPGFTGIVHVSWRPCGPLFG
jgi:hypothetical protein